MRKGKFSHYYKLLNPIGEGVYGKVFKVKHRSTGLIRAAKMIPAHSVKEKAHQEMLVEFSLLKELDHPNILKIYELFKDNKNYYMVTELLEGVDVI